MARTILKGRKAELLFWNRPGLLGCYEYTDGLMSDSRLVLDSILDARRNGAFCLNYARVVNLEEDSNGVVVQFRDEVSKREHKLHAKVVVNCAGPWAQDLIKACRQSLARFSRGVLDALAEPKLIFADGGEVSLLFCLATSGWNHGRND